MSDCLFPTCTRKADPNGFCIFHKLYSDSVSVKPKKAVPKESDKMKSVKKELKKMYPVFLAKNPECNIKSPVCTKKATVINHTRGREGNVLNVEDWESSCENCNRYIEEHHDWGRENNHKKPRHQNESNR